MNTNIMIELKDNSIFYGSYKLLEKDVLYKAFRNAYDAGIRHFDLAELYKNQNIIGDFFQENNIEREEIWLTSKVSFRSIPKGEDSIRKSIDKTFLDLKVEYIDLMLIHAPTKNNKLCWDILNEYKKSKKIRYIGVSNFNVIELEKFCKDITNPEEIYCNQIEFNPFLNRSELINICKNKNIKLSCYGTLYKTNDFIDSLQEKYKKTTKQLLIQFVIQKGFHPIIMAIDKEHIDEDFKYESFYIDKEDFNKIDMFDENYSLYKRYL
jgi:diketogulonate reductase-like aldo/keto reductase